MGDGVTKAIYARRAKLSHGRVSDLIAQGLPTLADGKIDPAAADAWLAENIDPARKDADKRGRSAKAGKLATVAEARRKKIIFDLELSNLNLRERKGELVERAEVERFIFERAHFERDQWLGWIARTAPALAHELNCDPAAAFAALDRMVREHLAERQLEGYFNGLWEDVRT